MMGRFVILFSILIWPIALFGQKWDSRVLRTLADRQASVTAHVFSHSGKILALANTKEMKFWDLKSHRIIQTIPMPDLDCHELAFKAGDSEIVMVGNRMVNSPPPNFQNTKDDVFSRIKYLSVITQLNIRSKVIHETIDSSSPQRELSSDGLYIAELSDSGKLTLRTVQEWNVVASIQLPVDTTTIFGRRHLWLHQSLKDDSTVPYSYRRNSSGMLWFMVESKELAIRWYDKLMIFNVPALHKLRTFSYSKAQTLGDGIYLPQYLSSFTYDLKNEALAVIQPLPLLIIPASVDSTIRDVYPSAVYLFDKAFLQVSQYSVYNPNGTDAKNPSHPLREDTVIFSFWNTQEPWGMRLDSNMRLANNSDDGKILLFSDRSKFIIVNVITHDVRKLEEIMEMK